jgi:hypothetical protein
MSGGEDKSFLSRWSQRKQEAKQPEPNPEPKPDEQVAEASPPPEPAAEGESEPEFDLSSLPKLDEMTGTTDITGFLRKGVPEQLRNAALRQSWALDPAIRNYVNPALEYAYDWNTPGGVPGSSEIGAGMDVARLVSQIMGTGESPAETPGPAGDPATKPDDPAQTSEPEAAQAPVSDLPTQSLRLGNEGNSVAQDPGTEAAQVSEPDADNAASQRPVRRHGSAKPIV